MVLLGILISTLDVQYLVGKIGHKMRKIGKKIRICNQIMKQHSYHCFSLISEVTLILFT